MSDFPVRVAVADDYEALVRCFGDALMHEFKPDDTAKALFEPERALAVDDGDEVVGTAKVLTRDMSVPGAVVPAAHVTGVGVKATHRRRGILKGLMTKQLQDVPEAFAVLWASEPAIYGRFGYGPAAWGTTLEVELPRVKPLPPPQDDGRLTEISPEGAGERIGPVLDELMRRRPGLSGRNAQWWVYRLHDPEEHRNGWNKRKILVHEDASGTIDGYALVRTKLSFNNAGPNSEVQVQELVGLTAAAYHALWHHFLSMDLATKLECTHAALDEPLAQLVANPEALNRRISETLWVRITDVPRALEQRRYATAVDVVLEIGGDDLFPRNNGRFRLVADGDKVSCEPTNDEADLALQIGELGAVYLGARSLTEFAFTGRVRELRPDTLARAATAFSWPVAPGPIEIF